MPHRPSPVEIYAAVRPIGRIQPRFLVSNAPFVAIWSGFRRRLPYSPPKGPIFGGYQNWAISRSVGVEMTTSRSNPSFCRA